jgi:hypothetical protein
MQVKLRKAEQAGLVTTLKNAYTHAAEIKETVYIALDTARRKYRVCFTRKPQAGFIVLAVIQHTAIPSIYAGDVLEDTYQVFMAWPIICPDVEHGNGHAGGRYTPRGIEICNAVPCEVW